MLKSDRGLWKARQAGATCPWLVVVFAIGALASSAHGAVMNVPAGFPTIQQAINAAANGDEIIVAAGTYNENINFGGKNLNIHSTNYTNPAVIAGTIIDGGAAGRVVTFTGVELATCRLAGFTIRNGRAVDGAGIYGGNTAIGSRALIEYCVITGNVSTGVFSTPGTGGGILNCDGTVQFCNINSNQALNSGGAFGRGAGLDSCDGNILDCVITGNTSTHGAGLGNCDAAILRCEIHSNTAAGDGGGMSGCDGTIQNCMIYGNTANNGAGMSWCNGFIEFNTIAWNAATNQGGALYRCDGAAVITGCIFWSNDAADNRELTLSNNPTYSCITGTRMGSTTNISADPMFVNAPSDDFRIMGTSPCVDAGTTIPFFTTDFDSNPRPVNGTTLPRGDGSEYDIGAHEYQGGLAKVLNTAVIGAGRIVPVVGQHLYASGDVAALAATPEAGWVFSEWQGHVTGSTNPANLTMSANRSATAVFVADATATARISGSVTRSGTAIGCATVVAVLGANQYLGSADVAGQYVIDGLKAGTYTVTAYSACCGKTTNAVTLAAGEVRALNLALTALGAPLIRGTVTDDLTGRPIVGARVQAWTGGTLRDTTYTCATGEYALRFSAKDATKATDAVVTFSAAGYEDEAQVVSVTTGTTVTANEGLVLKTALPGMLTGTVRHATTAAGVPSVRVDATLLGVGCSATTNASGQYTIPNLEAGSYSVRVSCAGFVSADRMAVIAKGGNATQLDINLSPASVNPPTGGGGGCGTLDMSARLPEAGEFIMLAGAVIAICLAGWFGRRKSRRTHPALDSAG